ncbi:MAG TPA: hypothetical protein VMD79_06385 [Solirubrobacteraceae bacterium]|nr:hypothetical protein [Solirubrobacteraceae bacterium]
MRYFGVGFAALLLSGVLVASAGAASQGGISPALGGSAPSIKASKGAKAKAKANIQSGNYYCFVRFIRLVGGGVGGAGRG